MTDLVPLLQTSSDETELLLLRALTREEPSAAAMARTAAALGVGASALTVAGTATAASTVTGIVKSSIWAPVFKALAIGASSGLIVSAGAHSVLSEPPGEADPAPAAAAPAARGVTAKPSSPSILAPSTPVLAAVEEAPKAVSTPSVQARAEAPQAVHNAQSPIPLYPPVRGETPAARATFAPLEPPATERAGPGPVSPPPASTAAAPSAEPKAASATPSVSIAEEVRAVDRARQALASGRARVALNELERYRAEWPKGVFTSEVLVLRVEAKLKLGDRASAEREARALIDAAPNSRYAARLRALIETSK